MTPRALCERYLKALKVCDLPGMLALFTPDASIASPLYGHRSVPEFYAELFAFTGPTETELLNSFDRSVEGQAVALHFRYLVTLKPGKIVPIECVDVFDLSEDRDRFTKLTIIYDTARFRADLVASRVQP